MTHWRTLSFFLLATSGCGPAGQSFHGLYAVTGTAHYSIPELGNASFPVADTFRISEGTVSDLVLTEVTGRCFLLADVQGEVAQLTRGASCAWSDDGIAFRLTLEQGRVSHSGEGRFDLSGSVTATARGKMSSGRFFQNATLTRVGD